MQQIDAIRDKIDSIDTQIISLLSERISVMEDVAAYKRESNLPVNQPERERVLLERLQRLACEKNVDAELVKRLYSHILEHSKSVQAKILGRSD